jgi:hypothetical protein
MIDTRTIVLRQLANGAGWTFSWSNNTRDSICNLHLPPFPTKEDAEKAAQSFISQQQRPYDWKIENPC